MLRAILYASFISSSAFAQPVIGHASDERINYPELGISITVPKDTTLIGSQGSQEPHNYIWPWLKTPDGLIDIATGPKALEGNLSKTLDAFLKAEHPRGFKLIKVTPMQIGDIPLIKAVSENDTGFKIVRFYFLSPSGLLAFFHLHSWSDQSALEGIVSSIKKTEQGAAANP